MRPTPKFTRRVKTQNIPEDNWSSAEIKREMFRLGMFVISLVNSKLLSVTITAG